MGSAQVRLAWTSPTLTSCFRQSEPDSPPSPLTTPTCLTRSSTRRRKSRRARKKSLRRRKRRKKNMKKRCRQIQTSENQFEARCLKDGNFLKARQEAKKGELDEQLREYINEWRKQ